MSLEHPGSREWERRLKTIFDSIDSYLEDTYGHLFPLHPSRMGKGQTSNPESDGLFNVGASFSAGYGSHYGRGYVIDIHFSTLFTVPEDVRRQVQSDVMRILREKLPVVYPGKKLCVDKDGEVYKIHGDLSFEDLV